MPETGTKSKATTAAQASSKTLTGLRAIIWNPQADPREQGIPVLVGYENVRLYVFVYVNQKKTEVARQANLKTLAADRLALLDEDLPGKPMIDEFRLIPGLNWIKAEDWELVQRISAKRQEADIKSTGSGVDEIAALVEARAIVAYEPKQSVLDNGLFEGRLEDYETKTLSKLFALIDDVESVRQFLQDAQSPESRQVITNRLAQLQS